MSVQRSGDEVVEILPSNDSSNEARAITVNDKNATADDANDSIVQVGEDGGIVVSSTIGMIKPKPQIGLFGAVTFAMGCVIGSGIFVSPKGALRYAGSPGASLLVWTTCGIMTLVTGLVYCELGSMVTTSGGDYNYTYMNIGPIPAFLVFWAQQLIGTSASQTILALTFADYLGTPVFGSCGPPESIRKAIAALVILTICITNIISVKFVQSTQIFFTVAKTSALIVISVGGLVYLAGGKTELLSDAFEGSADDVTSYALAFYSCMFAYGGSQRINEFTEEIINPKRTIPKALIIAITAVTLIYILTNISYFAVISKEDFLKSPAVAYEWGNRVITPAALLIPISVMCSVYGTANGQGFATGRVVFAVARNEQFPEVFSFLHMRTAIPVMSIIAVHLLSIILLIPGEVETLINITSFVGSIAFLLSSISVLRMRSKVKRAEQTFRTPLIVPLVAIVFYTFMIVAPFVSNPRIELVYGVALILGGLVFYIPFVWFKLRIPGFDTFVVYLQLLFQICPTPKLD